MLETDCLACTELRENVPELVVNGWQDEYCATMESDNGLGYGNNDCEDLNTMNNCLIGNMADEAQIAEVCDWRSFMSNFITNIWTVFKAIICAICGIWDQIWMLWENVERLWCILNYHSYGEELIISEDDTGESYIVAGKGVSFLEVGQSGAASQVGFEYIAGGLVQVHGSLAFNQNDFTDEGQCWNYDLNGVDPRYTQARKGNSYWHNTTGTTVNLRSELLYEIRISLAQYPKISKIFNGIGSPTGAGAYQVNLIAFEGGRYIHGQHGLCDPATGDPIQVGDDRGHLVPNGWIYVQARMTNVSYLVANGNKYSPRGFMGIQFDSDEIHCDEGGYNALQNERGIDLQNKDDEILLY